MTKRLIETAFPLAQASAASLHEKNMRHGHISTLHLWPARRPLAASRAAIAAALLPDPGDDEQRGQLVHKLGGELIRKTKKAADGKEQTKQEPKGGVLWWSQESSPALAWFRDRIREANGGKAPRILDPFAGGGAIPLEAMRLGCEVEARDLNPVAWFILKCTLEYPQKIAGERRPLPAFVLQDRAFMDAFLKAQGFKGARLKSAIARAAGDDPGVDLFGDPARPWTRADLGWHVRAWGTWVLAEARRVLALRYPTYAEWTVSGPPGRIGAREPVLLEPDANGLVDASALNGDRTAEELADPRNPRWIATPTVAYLWARTVRCKSCRAIIPLLKTRWLCKRDGKRVRLVMEPNAARDGVDFQVEADVPVQGASAARKRSADKELGGGTMSRAGAKCPCCPGGMDLEDIRFEGKAKRLRPVMTAVVVDGPGGKEYRRPTAHELAVAEIPDAELDAAFADVPFGRPHELIPLGSSRSTGGSPFSTPGYGLREWIDLFTHRQGLIMATLTRLVGRLQPVLASEGYSASWCEALRAYAALANDRVADRCSSVAHWDIGREGVVNTFSGFRLPISWDFAESAPLGNASGSYANAVDWIGRVVDHTLKATSGSPEISLRLGSAMHIDGSFDAVVTDPPYYDAIPYSDLMDFFYVWLRRALKGMSNEVDAAFAAPLGPKWDHDARDGELIDESSRFGGDRKASKRNFEDGMASVFRRCHTVLKPDGVLVIVFANKSPDAWETLVGAIIRAGFVVDGSLPIQTEMGNRTRALSSAALSSSVWLVCRKRPASARPGYDRPVLAAMRANITQQMRRFWDAGIRGPDFLWAATGPALEAYSRHPVVLREATDSGTRQAMPVSEFLREVRRLVVEFAVGRVLHGEGKDDNSDAAALDDVTTYYLLHRQSFGMADAPVGAAILYAMSCGLSDAELTDRWEILARGKSLAPEADEDDTADEAADGEAHDEADAEDTPEDISSGGGSTVRLRAWSARTRKALGLEGVGGKPVPLIDRLHLLMRLWKTGDVGKVDTYLAQASLARDPLFAELVQAVIELARKDGKADELSLLETISTHIQSRQGLAAARQSALQY